MTLNEITETSQFEAELVKEAEKFSTDRVLLDIRQAMTELPDTFKALTNAINQFAAAEKAHIDEYKEFRATFGKTLGLGVSAKLAAFKIKTVGVVEENVSFVATLKKIGASKDQREKMDAAIRLAEEIDAAIESRRSKILKMQERLGLDGSSEAEIAVCRRQIAAMEKIVDELKARKDAVSQVYCAAKKDLLKFIDKCDERFTPEFVNESTGKAKEAK